MNGADQVKAKIKLSSLQIRILSGVILGPLTLFLIYLGQMPFFIFMLVAAMISVWEWWRMSDAGEHPMRDVLIGALYMVVAYTSFIWLRTQFLEGLFLVATLLLCVWASDIGAYFAGRAIGGPKLAPRVSPNKTWAGFIGAMVSSGAVLTILFAARPSLMQWTPVVSGGLIPIHSFVVFLTGCWFGAVGQAGDLLISAFKRRVGVKDTGNLIPGHGGLLDRIDSLLLVSPVFLLAYMVWLR